MLDVAAALETVVNVVWGTWLVSLLVATGVVLTIRLGLPQFRGMGHAFAIVRGKFDTGTEPGDVSHFQALSAALSATVGLVNIAGVAIAISMGGPGALLWMWVSGFLGMATKCGSCTLAVKYRRFDANGHVLGGPMHYIEMGLGPRWRPVALLFGGLVAIASFGGGNMFQANQVGAALQNAYGIPKLATGLLLAIGVAAVIIGGIRRIGKVAAALVPAMCLIYILGGLGVLVVHIADVPAAFGLIFSDAFTGNAVAGGAVGAVIRQGIRRGTFSNEAGLGSAPIAHAAAKTNIPAREGLVALLEPFIDTLVVCTITGLVIVVTGFYGPAADGMSGVALTSAAFDSVFMGFGTFFVNSAVLLFAYSTVISWSYYGEQGTRFVLGDKAVLPFKAIFVAMTVVGAVWELGPIVNFSDICFGLMAVPNVIALLALSGTIANEHRDYFAAMRAQKA